MFEPLEPRVLLSATAVADLFTADAVVIVEGNVLDNDVAGLTAPARLAYEASSEDGGDRLWTETGGEGGPNLELGTGVEFRGSVSSDLPGITQAFQFTGGGGATMPSLQALAGDPTDGAASFELWVRPDDLADTDVLLETGSASSGLMLSTDGASLRFEVTAGGGTAGQIIADADSLLRTGEFNQVVGTIDPAGGGGELTLHLNGEQIGSTPLAEEVSGWADDDATGLGTVAGSAAGGDAAGAFEGEIAAFRFYESVLSTEAVRDHYSARAARVTASGFITELGGVVSVAEDGSFTYDPRFIPEMEDLAPGESATDRFTYEIDDGFGEISETQASVEIRIEPPETDVDLSGAVFEDLDNDGVRDAGEAGIEGVTVQLFNAESGEMLAERQTDADGRYLFDADLGPGTYELVQVQPEGYLDGAESVGELGGTVQNDVDSNKIGDIVVSEGDASGEAGGYRFGELRGSELTGRVWLDLNQDGEQGFLDLGLEGTTLHLSGTDDRGDEVSLIAQTDWAGRYGFHDLRPGEYSLREFQPEWWRDGADVLGTVNGLASGEQTGPDTFSGIELVGSGSIGAGYEFTERFSFRRFFGGLSLWWGWRSGSSSGQFVGGERFSGGDGDGDRIVDVLEISSRQGGSGGQADASERGPDRTDDRGWASERNERRRGWR